MSDEICFLCGKRGADTREHILSRALYPPPRPSDMLTAPSHETCNKSTARDEEWLAITWAVTRPFPEMNQERYDRALRALKREESAKMRDAFFASFTAHESGGAFLHVELSRVQYVLAKIVKGLVFHEDGLLISTDHTWWIKSIDLAIMVERSAAFTHQVEVHDVVVFRWETLGPSVFWALALFNMHIYWGVTVAPADFDRLAGRIPALRESSVRLPWPKPKD